MNNALHIALSCLLTAFYFVKNSVSSSWSVAKGVRFTTAFSDTNCVVKAGTGCV